MPRQPSTMAIALCLGVVASACPGTAEDGPGSAEPKLETPPTDAPKAAKARLLILGFDGVDPRWLQKWAGQGALPTLHKLMQAHGGKAYRPLRSTNPPQSPVAWTSFATGTRPGAHGVFDFIGRTLNAGPGLPVLPKIATTSFEVPKTGPPVARNLRTGTPFWQLLGNAGVRVVALNVPYSFPPDPMRSGRMLSGLGVPDLRETNSTFTYVGTDVTTARQHSPPGGGAMVVLEMKDNKGSFQLQGPSLPGESRRMAVELAIETGGSRDMLVAIGARRVSLSVGKLSDWVQLEFSGSGRKVAGIVRFLALEVGKQTRLFITPISFHPAKPYSPISYPKKFSAELAEDLGSLYKTVGWDHDTSALNAEVLDEGAFLADMDDVERHRRKMLLKRMDADDWDLLIWVSTSTDRVAHMFYRLIDEGHPRYDAALARQYGSAVEAEYRRMDATVAQVLPRLRPDDVLLIMSDHGFHSYRRGLHVNQWLLRQGLLQLRDGKAASDKDFFIEVDWSKTKAYAMGTGQIYLNLRGRERDGIVSAADAPGLMQQISESLKALTDEARDGVSVVDNVYLGSEVFKGGRSKEAPDLQIAFAEHYRTSWESILGGIPQELFADNPKKWSGDHAASDVDKTPGILIANRPLARNKVEIVDLPATALAFFGKDIPGHYAGKSVLP